MSFDTFAQRATDQATRPWFFLLVCAAVLAWVPTLFLWEVGTSDLLVDSITNPLSLLLLVLLQNSQSRQEKAQDSRQDQLEHSLALLLRHSADREEDDERRQALHKAAEQLVANARSSTSMSTAGEQSD